jgi:hypothetical protein
MTSDIQSLLSRLETATEGSRELDYEIWRVLHGAEHLSDWEDRDWLAYTQSVDAALTLVPGDAWLEMRRPLDGRPPIARLDINRRPYTCAAEAPTLALALVVAALRARGA